MQLLNWVTLCERLESTSLWHAPSQANTLEYWEGGNWYIAGMLAFSQSGFYFHYVFRHFLPSTSNWTAYLDARIASLPIVFKWHAECRPVMKRGISGAKGEPSKTRSKQNTHYRPPSPTRFTPHPHRILEIIPLLFSHVFHERMAKN